MHLANVFELAGLRYPEVCALVDGDRRWSYGDWNRRVNAVAWALLRSAVRPGGRVAFCTSNREAAATTYVAVQKLGATAVFLNGRWKSPELAYAIDDADVDAALYDETTEDAVLHALDLCGVKPVRISAGRERFAGEPGGPIRYSDLTADPTDDAPPISRPDDAVSSLLYTSGTTGRPKGVVRTHKSDYHAALAMVLEHRWRRFERTLTVMPFYHTMGLHTLLSMVVVNGTCVLFPRFDPQQCLEAITRERITTLYLAPTAFHDLAKTVEGGNTTPPRIRTLIYAGAPMSRLLTARCRKAFRPEVFINHYGCTEMHVIATNADLKRKPSAAGRAALHQRIAIATVDRERLVAPDETLPPGELGEVIVEAADSPQAFSGYLNRRKATERALRGGWYFTGDLGYVDGAGDLHLQGRVDEMIITGGENVYPEEVERVLLRHPQVEDVAVVGLPHERWGQVVTAFIVSRPPKLDGDELEQYCLADPELARYKRPRHFVFLEQIPKSPTGKILRSQLRQGRYSLIRGSRPGKASSSSPHH